MFPHGIETYLCVLSKQHMRECLKRMGLGDEQESDLASIRRQRKFAATQLLSEVYKYTPLKILLSGPHIFLDGLLFVA